MLVLGLETCPVLAHLIARQYRMVIALYILCAVDRSVYAMRYGMPASHSNVEPA